MLYYSDPRSFHLAGYTFWYCMYVLCVRYAIEVAFRKDSVREGKRESRPIDSSPYSNLSFSFILHHSSLPLNVPPFLFPSHPPFLISSYRPSLSSLPSFLTSLPPNLPPSITSRPSEWADIIWVFSEDRL